jgi:NADH-quinone oxidoreductase subunit J
VVLIIFSIFLTQQSGKEMSTPDRKRKIAAIAAVLLGFILSYRLIDQYGFPAAASGKFVVKVSDVGSQMLSATGYGYALPFEVVSILLLSSMIGCIVIAMKTPEGKTIQPDDSIKETRKPEELLIGNPFTEQSITETETLEEPL